MRKTLLILMMVLLATVATVYGAATLQVPAASATVSTNQTLNVTLAATDVVYTNCSFWALSSSTANSTYELLGTDINDTEDDAAFNYTWDPGLQKLEDSNDYTFKADCSNDTTVLSDTSTSVTIDMTNPATPSSLSPADNTEDTDSASTFSATVGDSTTTSCSLAFDGRNPGAPSYSMTYSATSCTVSLTDVPNGIYDWYIVASDGTDTTNSVIRTIDFANPTTNPAMKAVASGMLDESGKTTSGSRFNTKTIGILVLLGVVVYVLLDKKK